MSGPFIYVGTWTIKPGKLEAARKAVRNMVAYLMREHAYDRNEAYALASVCVDLRISEVVDVPNWCVSAFFPRGVIDRPGPRSSAGAVA